MSHANIITVREVLRQLDMGKVPFPLLSLATLGICRLWANYLFAIFDDALITFRYADNLCKGKGLVYNLGDWVLGTTAPLYSLILSSMCMVNVTIEYSSMFIGVISDLTIGVLVFKVISQIFSDRAGTIFLLLFSLSPTLNLICASGMESSLFLLALVVAVLLFTQGYSIVAVLVATLACFLRPEAVLLLLVFGLAELTRGRVLKALTLVVVSLTVAIPALFLIYAFYGTIVPQSVAAKATAINGSALNVAQTLFWSDRLTALMLPLAVMGVVPCLRQPGFTRFLFLFATIYALAYLSSRPHMWPWYGTPTILAITIAAGVGADVILRQLPRFDRWLKAARVQLAAPVLMVISFLFIQHKYSGYDVTRNLYVPLAQWCAHNYPSNSDILAGDIGAVGYYCGGRVFDSAALVWPEAMQYSSELEMIKHYRPRFIFIGVTEEGRMLLSSLEAPFKYDIVQRFSSRGIQEMDPSKISWSRSWVQDYLMLRASP
jgi:hypothetical protein